MMTATDTEAALLAAIRENPGEDAPRLVLADWLEENAGAVACGACKGQVWPLVPPPDVIETVNTFGVVTRYAKLGPFKAVMPCSACHGTGRTPAIGPRLAQRWPIERVEVTDANPSHEPRLQYFWPPFHKNIPRELWNSDLIFEKLPVMGRQSRRFSTEPAARAALSDALIAWARSQPTEEGRS